MILRNHVLPPSPRPKITTVTDISAANNRSSFLIFSLFFFLRKGKTLLAAEMSVTVVILGRGEGGRTWFQENHKFIYDFLGKHLNRRAAATLSQIDSLVNNEIIS